MELGATSSTTTITPVEKPFTVNDDGQSIVPGCPSMINRADVARYMLDVIDDESSYRKIRAIGIEGDDSYMAFIVEQIDEFKKVIFRN